MFDGPQAAAIVAYLELKREANEFAWEAIDQALGNFWRNRAAKLSAIADGGEGT